MHIEDISGNYYIHVYILPVILWLLYRYIYYQNTVLYCVVSEKVVVMQSYKNNMTEPIEAKYVFPLGETAAVCGFEAFINGKHIIGIF